MIVLNNGDKIRGDAGTAAEVDFTISGFVGTTATPLAGGQLPNAIGDLYTSGADATIVTGIILVNTGAGTNACNLYRYANGGTTERIGPKDISLLTGYSLHTDGLHIVIMSASGELVLTYSLHASSHAGAGADPITSIGAFTATGTVSIFDAGGETISGDGTDLTLASGAKINLTATSDVVVPVNIGIILGDGAEKLESDNTDLTINSGVDINLTATGDINVPANVGVTFGDDGEKIEGDGTDLTIASSNLLNLTATTDVVIPVNVGLHLGDGAEKLESDNTDLTINSGVDINLTATTDVNLPANVGLTFGDDGEKIEGDGTDLTIASSGVLNLTATTNVALNSLVKMGEIAIELDDALSADGKWCGIAEDGTAGATLAFGDCVYFAVADSRWELTDADAEATAFGKIGICILAAANDGSATKVLLYGKVRADTAFPALTIGAPVFIGTTAGDIQMTAPSGAADIVRVVGYGNTADELFFCPSPVWIEIAA